VKDRQFNLLIIPLNFGAGLVPPFVFKAGSSGIVKQTVSLRWWIDSQAESHEIIAN
jgi:hypothetical protein